MIRPGTPQDARFLRDMLRHAYYWRSSGDEDETGLHPMRYVENWGRPGDAAVIALDEGFPVGAAWYRLFKETAPGYGFVDEQTPELSIAVVPSRRGHGFGGELMDALLARARARGLPRDQPQRRGGQPRGAALRALRLREGRRARRRLDDAHASPSGWPRPRDR